MLRFTKNLVIREPLLVAILVLLASIFFAVTHAYTQAYDRRRDHLGRVWFEQATNELHGNHPKAAVDGFRTALLYAPENWNYRLRLAEALNSAGRTNEALAYYRSLWQSNPSSAPVNLQLARLAEAAGDHEAAERYFNGAIFGVWDTDAASNRREALFEMIDFYLRQNDIGSADSQLIVLTANLPEDPALHARVAGLFLKVNDDQRALDQYRQALFTDRDNEAALRGAGEAAFRLGRYRDAKSYLDRAVRRDAGDAQAKNLLDTTNWVLNLDPMQPGVRSSEKAARVVRGFQIAGQRLKSCAAQLHVDLSAKPAATVLGVSAAKWNDLAPQVTPSRLQADSDLSDNALNLAFLIEQQTRNLCGEPSGADLALLTLAQKQAVESQ